MQKNMILAETLALKRPSLILNPNDYIGKTDFLNPKMHSGAAAVMERGVLIGILTERDLLKRALAKGFDPQTTLVREIMSPDPVQIPYNADLKTTLQTIIKSGFRYLPVMKERQFVGMLDIRDLYITIQKLLEETLCEERALFASMMAEPYGVDNSSHNSHRFWA